MTKRSKLLDLSAWSLLGLLTLTGLYESRGGMICFNLGVPICTSDTDKPKPPADPTPPKCPPPPKPRIELQPCHPRVNP